MKLNLGCGNKPKKGWINHDRKIHNSFVQVEWNLNDVPWPWGDAIFSNVCAISVLEHLEIDLITALNECWRILKLTGILYVKYPVYTSETIHDDPTHRWHWSCRSFDFVDPTTAYGLECGYYTDRTWKTLKKQCDGRNGRITLRKVT